MIRRGLCKHKRGLTISAMYKIRLSVIMLHIRKLNSENDLNKYCKQVSYVS